MGLDSYLSADIGLSEYNEHKTMGDEYAATQLRAAIKAQYGEAMESRNADIGLRVILPLAYWRKANQIHAWFVKNVQEGKDECQKSYVERKDLEKLLADCKAVLADPSKAASLLPTQAGFFFGGTEYDEYYVHELSYTVDALERVLAKLPENADIYYHASW